MSKKYNKGRPEGKIWAIVDKFGNRKHASGILYLLEETLANCPADYKIIRIK